MLLRNHPLLTYWNGRSWSPDWLWCGGFDNTHPRGEVGILKTVFVSFVKPLTSCFLAMEHAGAEYMGELFISDAAFCLAIYEVLLQNCGKTIQEIGETQSCAIGQKPRWNRITKGTSNSGPQHGIILIVMVGCLVTASFRKALEIRLPCINPFFRE